MAKDALMTDEEDDGVPLITPLQSLREIHRRLTELAESRTFRSDPGTQVVLLAEVTVLGRRIAELECESCAKGTFHLNASRSVAVGTERFIRDFTNCPRGAKVQLLNPGGVAIYGIYDGDPQWIAWYPVPGSPK